MRSKEPTGSEQNLAARHDIDTFLVKPAGKPTDPMPCGGWISPPRSTSFNRNNANLGEAL
jgi:hypothetical protein